MRLVSRRVLVSPFFFGIFFDGVLEFEVFATHWLPSLFFISAVVAVLAVGLHL